MTDEQRAALQRHRDHLPMWQNEVRDALDAALSAGAEREARLPVLMKEVS